MQAPCRFFIAVVVVTASFVSTVRVCDARPIEVATFPVDAGHDVAGLRVAAGTDGTMVLLWRAAGTVWAERYSSSGAPLGTPTAIGAGSLLRIAADTRGGYVTVFTRVEGGSVHLFGRRLDAAAQPVGAEYQVDVGLSEDVARPTVLGLPSGSAVVWQQRLEVWARIYDADGVALGDPFVVGDDTANFPLVAAPLADGGFVAVWHDPSVHTFLGRAYDGDGTPRGDAVFLFATNLDIQEIAGSPAGGFAVAGIVSTNTLRVARFANDLSLIGSVDVAGIPSTDRLTPMLASDTGGNWHVVWSGSRYDGGSFVGYLTPQARPFAQDLTPLEPTFELSPDPAPEVATALLQSGSFVNAWSSEATPGSPRGFANVVSLCTADVHVCGDGVFDARCEECDDGGGNSDSTPNACRTTCTLPRCGDGVADGGEACDDGDPSSCDGCDASCELVSGLACGDGILVPGCGQCDDGNAVAGDGCASTCTIERVPGGGTAKTDCYAEWVVQNPTNVPLFDRHGYITAKQRCTDNDPACDFDGGVPGRCTFRMRVCADNTDVVGCAPPAELASWELTKPSVTQAAKHAELAAVRASFAGVPGMIVGPATPDVCSDVLEVVVPMRGAAAPYRPGKLTLKSVAASPAGVRDKDTLKLACLPPG